MRHLVYWTLASAIVVSGCGTERSEEAAEPEIATTVEPGENTVSDENPPDPGTAPPSKRLDEIRAHNEQMLARLQEEMDRRQETAPERTHEEMIAAAREAVVVVQVDNAIGSGFFVEPDIIVTNHHVVSTKRLVTIKMDDQDLPARVLRTVASHDLALVELYEPLPDQELLELGSIEELELGEEVYAIGSPYGFTETVTRGVVSGIRSTDAVTFVQTDTPLNPGNSGGPLLNARGRVVGVNTGGLAQANRMGFSVAADHVAALLAGATALEPLPIADSTRNATLTQAFERRGTPSASSQSQAEPPPLHDQLEEIMRRIAREADAVDRDYAKLTRECNIDRNTNRSTARPTVSLVQSPGAATSSGECSTRYNALYARARKVWQQVQRVSAEARSVGIDQSTIDYVLRAHRLDW